MKLTVITLENFRCYQDLTLNLHPTFTVLVANNGCGKTTILDAIRIALWPYVSQFDLAKSAYNDSANAIALDDVRLKINSVKTSDNPSNTLDDIQRQLPTKITLTVDNDSGTQTWTRYRDSEAKNSKTKDDPACRELKKNAKKLQATIRTSETPIDLPVFGYYGTGRLWKEKRLMENKKFSRHEKQSQNIRTFAYLDCLDPASSYRHFEQWFSQAYLKILEDQIKQLEQGKTSIEVDPILKTPVKVVQEAVNELLNPVGWKNLQFSKKHGDALVLTHDNYGTMKAEQLSDGIKNMLAMVGDIAYRCVLLNTHLGEGAAKQSQGVVMIDEVDMHLHPIWQQKIAESLQRVFPNIQFIVTTHSPQVLSTIKAESIRVLEHEYDENSGQWLCFVKTPNQQSRGVSSTELLAEIQAVDPIPEIEEARWLKDYKALIMQNNHLSEQGQKLKDNILAHFGEEHPEWLECQRLLRLQEMKATLKKNNA